MSDQPETIDTVLACRHCGHVFTALEYRTHGGCTACGRPAVRRVDEPETSYGATFDHAAQAEFIKQEKGGAAAETEPAPKRKRERRAGNQDQAMVTAFVEGTLPEVDRRDDGEGAE